MNRKAKKLNLLHVISGLGVGGAEKLLIDLVKFADKNVFNVFVCYVTRGQDRLEDEIRKQAVQVFCLGRRRKTPGFFALFGLIKIIIDKKIDIVHTHLKGADICGRIAGFLTKRPVIISTKHNTFNEKYYYTVLNRILATATTDKVVVVSKKVREFCLNVDRVPSKKLLLIYNGVNCADFEANDDSRDSYPTFGTVASFIEQKGHGFLLEAVAMVKRKHPDIKLLLVGEGILKGKMEEMCEALDLQENVMFLGDRSDVPDLLSRMDFFVLPSLWEGLPISLLEASASKLPVIATKVSGSEEVVIDGKTGILVPPGDPSALSLAITWMIENRKKAKAMGDEGRKRVKENFNIRTAVKTYEELYEYIYKYKLSSKKK